MYSLARIVIVWCCVVKLKGWEENCEILLWIHDGWVRYHPARSPTYEPLYFGHWGSICCQVKPCQWNLLSMGTVCKYKEAERMRIAWGLVDSRYPLSPIKYHPRISSKFDRTESLMTPSFDRSYVTLTEGCGQVYMSSRINWSLDSSLQ